MDDAGPEVGMFCGGASSSHFLMFYWLIIVIHHIWVSFNISIECNLLHFKDFKVPVPQALSHGVELKKDHSVLP